MVSSCKKDGGIKFNQKSVWSKGWHEEVTRQTKALGIGKSRTERWEGVERNMEIFQLMAYTLKGSTPSLLQSPKKIIS